MPRTGRGIALLPDEDDGSLWLTDKRIKRRSGFARNALCRKVTRRDDLTPRQLDILRSAARGLSNAEIGLQFDITKDMVKAHLKAAFKKLGAANRTEAVTIALRNNLLKI